MYMPHNKMIVSWRCLVKTLIKWINWLCNISVNKIKTSIDLVNVNNVVNCSSRYTHEMSMNNPEFTAVLRCIVVREYMDMIMNGMKHCDFRSADCYLLWTRAHRHRMIDRCQIPNIAQIVTIGGKIRDLPTLV